MDKKLVDMLTRIQWNVLEDGRHDQFFTPPEVLAIQMSKLQIFADNR